MGRYKGKRVAGSTENRKPEAFSEKPVGDPFAGDGEKPGFSVRMHHFWDSGKGKILLAVVASIAILGGAAGIAIKMLVKPPTPPSEDQTKPMTSVDKTPKDTADEPAGAGPTEDDLYPDDGYGGDMPTVSGNRKEGIYTFLLVGTDMDDGNTDTIMVASYDTKNQDISIMSIPRDTMVNESWDIKRINSVYSRYKDGMEALKKRIKTLVGFTPDFYVKVDLSMFVKLVDLIGGVEFDVPQDMNYDDPYQDLHIHLKKGVQVLDGEKAMEMVRFRRYSEGDIKRVEMQQNFMKALIKECLSIKHWGKIKSYIDLAMENVQTDLEFGSVVWFAANVLGLNSGVPALNMDDVYTCTIPGDYWVSAYSRSTHTNQSYVTIYPKQVVELVNERFNPYEQNVTTSMLDAMSILSNGNIASSTGSLRDTAHNAAMAEMRGSGSDSKKPDQTAEPKQDEDGRYYTVGEDGKKVYTDKDGKPLDQTSPDNTPDDTSEPSLPGIIINPTDGNQPDKPAEQPDASNNDGTGEPADTNTGGDSGTADPGSNPDDTDEPQLPPEAPDGGVEPAPPIDQAPVQDPVPDTPAEPTVDTEIPDWLLS